MLPGLWLFVLLFVATAAYASEFPLVSNTEYHSPNLISSGQPGKRQFEAIAASGVQVVINLAPKDLPKSLRNEEKLVRSFGMDYHFIPVDWDKPTQDDVDRFLAIMDEAAGKTVLVHCWVNARSSAFVYLYRVLRENRPRDIEYPVVERIWANNKGYEMRNVPHWQTFLDEVLARHQK